jgi:hypothetical protein
VFPSFTYSILQHSFSDDMKKFTPWSELQVNSKIF